MSVADEVRALRRRLDESTATFAARWHCSPRTVEDWEQGRSAPNAFVVEALRALAARTKTATKKKATKKAKG
jgi:DNA-binding transcriptional regulator YiaG